MIKTLIYIILACTTSLILLASCSKNANRATVIKDCTGSYVRMNNSDYLVCNKQILDSYASGTEIDIHFENMNACAAHDSLFFCEMYHASAGIVQINSIE